MNRLLIILLLIATRASSQSSIYTTVLSGAADGLAETLKWHYYKFERVFPNANDAYWNPYVSWTNKYKNNDYNLGPKFPGSTTVLVWTTDGYHMARMVRNITLATSITLHSRKKKRWTAYLVDAAIHSAGYNIGFNLVYDVIF